MSLLAEPHHDGVPPYLDPVHPALGQEVRLRLRTAPGDPATQVWVRTAYDAEPVYLPCAREDDGTGGTWWTTTMTQHSPEQHYRWLLAEATGQRWVGASGVVEHDGPDALDFRLSAHEPAPEWAAGAVVYQVFPDRFARSAAAEERPVPGWAVPAGWDDEVVFEGHDPRTPLQFFGGDLDGVTEHLDHVAEVGATVLYTTPVFPGESNHRYNATTFDEVDPLLGGDAAYARLSEAVHARGWRILGDLTTNHTGDTHEWFVSARDDADAPTRSWYFFDEHGRYACWMGHGTLPKLNWSDPDLRAAMVEGEGSVVGRWLHPPYAVDGWRIDVANMTGRLGAVDVNHETARLVRRTATAQRADAWVIGEHNHDASGDLAGDGWHGTMNYSGFSWPVWSWLRDPDSPARPFGRPVAVPRRGGEAVVRSLREWRARYGWRAAAQSWNILGSHDSARIRTLVGDPVLHRVAAVLQFTLPGVPMVFAGDEIGLEGVNGEDARRPMPWHRRGTWDDETLAAYGALAALRREHPALAHGGLRFVHAEDDALVYLREHPEGSLLVLVRRAAGGEVRLDLGALGSLGPPERATVAGDPLLGVGAVPGPATVSDGDLVLPAGDAGAGVWRLGD